MYYVAMNKADNQLTIIPAKFGIIGDATPLQWNGETAMQASYNETQAAVEYSISDVILDNLNSNRQCNSVEFIVS